MDALSLALTFAIPCFYLWIYQWNGKAYPKDTQRAVQWYSKGYLQGDESKGFRWNLLGWGGKPEPKQNQCSGKPKAS